MCMCVRGRAAVRFGGVGMRVLGRDDVPEKVRTWSVGHGMGE